MPRNAGVAKVYAVRKGRQIGVFSSWEEAKHLVTGFPGAQHKSFNSVSEAQEYLNAASESGSPVLQLQSGQAISPTATPTTSAATEPVSTSGPPSMIAPTAAALPPSGALSQPAPTWSSGAELGRTMQNEQQRNRSALTSEAEAMLWEQAASARQQKHAAHPLQAGLAPGAAGIPERLLNTPFAYGPGDPALPRRLSGKASNPGSHGSGPPPSAAPAAGPSAPGGLLTTSQIAAAAAEMEVDFQRSFQLIEGLSRPYLDGAVLGFEIRPEETYTVMWDGASRGNPGWAGCGAVVLDPEGRMVVELVASLPYGTTNNEAEYCGGILGLNAVLQLGLKNVQAYCDSQLVVMQLSGQNACRSSKLIPLNKTVDEFRLGVGPGLTISHVMREQNQLADRLANEGVDMHFGTGEARVPNGGVFVRVRLGCSAP